MIDQTVKPGALFAIPSGEVFGLAKVIFLSTYFRDVMLIRLFRDRARSPSVLSAPDPEAASALYYTGVGAAAKGRWVYIGHQGVSEQERAMTLRISGGEVWIEDTHLRPATDADSRSLQLMDVHGYRLIAKAIAGMK